MDTDTNLNFEQDQQAVQAVRGGDAERYRELVERHERRVFALAWSRLGDATMAEEVAQEAFIRAYQRLWLLGDGAKFSAWIAAITRRVAINCGLRNRRELNKRARWALEQPATPADEPTELCPPETLREALAGLPAAHRECLVLFYLEGKSGAEAAAALGISETALRVRLHRARAALREQLEEKLEGSLAKLGPSKTLVPAVMAGVLASSSAKAAAAGGMGAAVAGALAKLGLTKWLLPFAPLFSFLFLLPALFIGWLSHWKQLKNFRDQKGFRARLFRQESRGWFLWFALIMVLMPRLATFASGKTFFLTVAGIGLLQLPFHIRGVFINRSRFYIAALVGSIVLSLSFLLVGLGWMTQGWCVLLVMFCVLLLAQYQTELPRTMDYNLFLRGAEGLLTMDPATIRENQNRGAIGRKELLAFARFLGTRWLAGHYRWTEDGLELKLTPATASPSGTLRNLGSWSRSSRLLLRQDGKVTAQLGEKDRQVLQRLQGEKLPSELELEQVVSQAVASAWSQFQSADLAAAERAIGQAREADVFIKPRVTMLSTRVQRAIFIGVVLFIAGFFLLPRFYPGYFPSLSRHDISKENYQRAMSNLQKAKTEEKRFDALGDAAKESFVAGKFQDAQSYAQELMALLPKYQGGGNEGKAIHDGNLVLGRIAAREGRIEEAKSYLIAAGKSPGSPTLDSFGPNMTLAKDLLEKGERDTVLEYFTLCRRFWRLHQGKLDQWTQEVRNGKVPDFGANLFY